MASKPSVAVDNTQPSYSVAQLREMLKQAEEQQAKLLTPEKLAEIRQELEDHCQKKHGFSLSDVGLVEKKERQMPGPTIYIHPTTGKEYVYKGWGAYSQEVKEWLFKDGKPNQDYIKK